MTRSTLRWLGLVALALVVGFLIGTWRGGTHIDTGRADSTANGGGSITTDDWTYGFSADMPWTDATNAFHDSGTPDCLPPLFSVEGVRFAWVEASVDGSTWRSVVWIDCRSAHPEAQIDCRLAAQADCDRTLIGGRQIIKDTHPGTPLRIVVTPGRGSGSTSHTELHACYADGSYVLVDAMSHADGGLSFSIREQGQPDLVCQ